MTMRSNRGCRLRQAAELGQQVFLHGAADAAVLQAVHRVGHLGNDGGIDVQLAEIVDDHRQAAAFGTAHHAVEQGGFTGAEKARDDGHGDTWRGHCALPSSTGGSPCQTALRPTASSVEWRS